MLRSTLLGHSREDSNTAILSYGYLGNDVSHGPAARALQFRDLEFPASLQSVDVRNIVRDHPQYRSASSLSPLWSRSDHVAFHPASFPKAV